MKKVKVAHYEYINDLGETTLRNIDVYLDEDEVHSFKSGIKIEELNYGLSDDTILKAEKIIALNFFKNYYRDILEGKEHLNVSEITAIQHFLGINNVEFAKILGINKGSFSNIIKRGRFSGPVAVLIIERLGMELARPGSAKRLINRKAKLEKPDSKIAKEIDAIRFGKEIAA